MQVGHHGYFLLQCLTVVLTTSGEYGHYVSGVKVCSILTCSVSYFLYSYTFLVNVDCFYCLDECYF
jgi:general stress protein CsbA